MENENTKHEKRESIFEEKLEHEGSRYPFEFTFEAEVGKHKRLL
jgi:hypothetical protein